MAYHVVYHKGTRPDKLMMMKDSSDTEAAAISKACALNVQGGCLNLHIEDDNGRTVLTEREIMARCRATR
jgi:hypothetical protein